MSSSLYCKILKKKKNLSISLAERELKWHNELQSTFGTDYWNTIYSFTASIQNENKMVALST